MIHHTALYLADLYQTAPLPVWRAVVEAFEFWTGIRKEALTA